VRVLFLGGAPARLHRGPVEWAGYTFEMIPHQFDRMVKFDLFAPESMPWVSLDTLWAFSQQVRGYDAIFCETPEALILAREWEKARQDPIPLLAFDVHCLLRVNAMRRWYQKHEQIDPWPRIRRLPWISWIAPSQECLATMETAGVSSDRLYRINFSTALFSTLIPDADLRLDGGLDADGPAAGQLPSAQVLAPGSAGHRDLETCLLAARQVRDTGFWVVRAGVDRVENQLEKAGLIRLPNVHWIDPVPLEAYIALIKRAELIVLAILPGEGDSGHSTVSLAHRVGTPVVCSRVDGIIDYVKDGFDALLVPPGEPSALAAAIRRLRNDPSLREHLAVNGRASESTRINDCRDGFFRALSDAVSGLTG
jgi:glycosyltransferase involved in cell wall biosynthesis